MKKKNNNNGESMVVKLRDTSICAFNNFFNISVDLTQSFLYINDSQKI